MAQPEEVSRLAARAQAALNKHLPAEALTDFRRLEKLAADTSSARAARQGKHAALSALYREEQRRALLRPAHRTLVAAPDSPFAWWNWTRACLAAGDVDDVNQVRLAIEKLSSLPDTTHALRIEIARAAASPDTAPRLVDALLVLIEPALPPASAEDATLSPDQLEARALHNHFMSVWTEVNRAVSAISNQPDEEEEPANKTSSETPRAADPAERERLHATIRQAASLIERTRASVEETLAAAHAARDALLLALAEGRFESLELVTPFDAALAACDPALRQRQLEQARQRLARLLDSSLTDAPPEEIVNLAQAAVEEFELRAQSAADLQTARNSAGPILALLAERRILTAPVTDAAAEVHAAYLDRLNTFLARDWLLTRDEQRARARSLLALGSPAAAGAVLHASLALAPDGPTAEDETLLSALRDRSVAFTTAAQTAAATGDTAAALEAWQSAARLAPGDPAAWRALFQAARSVEGAEALVLEAAGRLWQLDAIGHGEIFAAGSLALVSGQPDWTHVLLSRLPDGGTAYLDTQLLRVLHAYHLLKGRAREQEFENLRRLLPPIDCLRALGEGPPGEIDLAWAPLKHMREQLPAPSTKSATPPANIPPAPVLGDPVLARFDASRRPGALPPDSRDASARDAARLAGEDEARRLLATDPVEAALHWARASSSTGSPISFAAFSAELVPILGARPDLLPRLVALPSAAREPLQRDILHTLPDPERDRLFDAHYEAARERLKTDSAAADRVAQRQVYKEFFASLRSVGDLLRSTGSTRPATIAKDGLALIPNDIESVYAYLFAIPDSEDAQAVLATLSPSVRAEVKSRATKQIAQFNQQVAKDYADKLGLRDRFSDSVVDEALSAIWRLSADHPDRKAFATAQSSLEQRRAVVIKYAQPIKERLGNRVVADLAITAAQRGTGTWTAAEAAARRAGGEPYARYLASAPGVTPAQIQSALSSGAVPQNWISRLQQAGITLAFQTEQQARARSAEFQARTGGGRYDINQTVYRSRYDSTGAGNLSYEKALRRELDRLYPTGR